MRTLSTLLVFACVTACASGPRLQEGAHGELFVAQKDVNLSFSGKTGALAGESLEINGVRPPFAEAKVLDLHTFYIRVESTAKMFNGGLEVVRTYETTPSGNIYAQLELRPRRRIEIHDLDWNLGVPTTSVAPPLAVRRPAGPHGGLEGDLPGDTYEFTEFPSVLERGEMFLVPVRVGAAGPLFVGAEYRLYANYGFVRPGFSGRKGTVTFADFNLYDLLLRTTPPTDALREDALIRGVMQLVRRMEHDDGWPRSPKWSRRFKGRDRFTAHARAFPPVAYLYGRLTRAGYDADRLYRAMQALLPYYEVEFADKLGGVATPYLAYSSQRKEVTERGPTGVLNTHAHALHFAALMVEVGTIAGRSGDAERWRQLVRRYHRGVESPFFEAVPRHPRKRSPTRKTKLFDRKRFFRCREPTLSRHQRNRNCMRLPRNEGVRAGVHRHRRARRAPPCPVSVRVCTRLSRSAAVFAQRRSPRKPRTRRVAQRSADPTHDRPAARGAFHRDPGW